MVAISFIVTCFTFLAGDAIYAQSDKQGVSRIIPEHRRAIDPERKPSIAVFIGAPDVRTETVIRSGSLEYSWQPEIPFSTAVELGVSVTNEDFGQTLTRTRLFAKANYNFGSDTPALRYGYVGLGLGPVWDNRNNRSDIQLGIGPQVGFDAPVSRWSDSEFSFGLNANFMALGGDRPGVLAVNGVAKYWF